MTVQFTSEQVALMQAALDRWGLNAQVGQTVEECAELIVTLQKYVNRTPQPGALDDILDELADVEMMLAQMRIVFEISNESYRERIGCKFEKLKQYLAESEV